MTHKQNTTGATSTIKQPVYRVRMAADTRWLRSFHSMDEARAFARKHAIEHNCSMMIEKPSQAELFDWEF